MDEDIQDDESEAIDSDPDFYRGYAGSFRFPNGDVYEGDYIAHITGLVWREGKGTYTTQDGQVYSGIWFNDELKDTAEVEITYADGTKYVGHIIKNQYAGSAMYLIQDGLYILGNFVDNKPIEEMCLIDFKGREWRAEALENDALFLPEHTFYNDIPPRLGKGILRIQRAKQSLLDMSTSKSMKPIMNRETLSRLEMKIFAKTRKTVSDLAFTNSDWYQNWISFRKIYDKIIDKVVNSGEDHLCQDERDWLEKYNEFKKKYRAIIDSRHEPKFKDLKECQLYELFNSEEYMPPISMFTATEGEEGSINKSDSDLAMGAIKRTVGTQI